MLATADASLADLKSVEALRNNTTTSDIVVDANQEVEPPRPQTHQPNVKDYNNEDLNDRESLASGGD